MALSKTAKFVVFGVILLSIPCIFIGYMVYGFMGRSNLINHHGFVAGKISGCTKGVKGSPAACNVRYHYVVDGSAYDGVTLFRPADLTYEDCRDHLTGFSFPVVYETGNPANSVILLSPAASKLYHYAFPDSVKWVARFVHQQ